MSGCRVTRCHRKDVPAGFLSGKPDCVTNVTSDDINATISADARHSLASRQEHDAASVNFCEPDGCDDDDDDCDFVDLRINPERHTGFSGEPSRRIWRLMYEFSERNKNQTGDFLFCAVSGLQSSINVHIVSQYRWEIPGLPFGPIFGGFGRNVSEFLRRFHPEMTSGQGPTWLKNLYFVYLLELKALVKVASQLRQYPFYTGDPIQDQKTQAQVRKLTEHLEKFPDFLEDVDVAGVAGTKLQLDFLNMSRVMDCVECEKCKLWGKLQVAGLGTALKILSAGSHYSRWSPPNIYVHLSRNEIVSLFNAFGRLSTSIHQLKNFPRII